jgi:hypothetical protein
MGGSPNSQPALPKTSHASAAADDEDVQDVKEQRDAAECNDGIGEPPARVLKGCE